MVLGVVCLFAFVLVFPTFRAYLAQDAQNALLRRQVAAAQAGNDNLAAELARWDDQAYVVAQARERLAYVLPGETAFRVVDPQSAPPVSTGAPTHGADAAALAADGTTRPWYTTLWGSVQVAGATGGTAAGENGQVPVGGGAIAPGRDGAPSAP
jgi:cell division protein FtsB